MATSADVSRLEQILTTHLRMCEDAGLCRAQMLWTLPWQTLPSLEGTVLLNSAIFLCPTDADWNDRMLRRGYLPVRVDETLPY